MVLTFPSAIFSVDTVSNPGNSKHAMIEVAERMFAERGLDGVSMRDIASASGQKNNSAVQYHFGGREGLVLEVFRRRMKEIDRTRHRFLDQIDAEGRGQDVRALVEAVVVPLADMLRTSSTDSFHVQFIARVSPSVDLTSPGLSSITEASGQVSERLLKALTHLPHSVAAARVDLMLTMAMSALAVFEQRRANGTQILQVSSDQTVAHLIDMSVGALEAPHTQVD
ncbi:TetR/AcrR family transcriptional regulator [Rhodococcus sp. ABRD24]|uniref:TetR/AcrR family transcriptional regulator n=1 Tax=Rhodococcus sp. ABRD24 TaxID=2507582 RepID=UPI001F622D4C|nr:TetR/AcrR family transcriptional regulator [Rhodococcus sp. ABRD24]